MGYFSFVAVRFFVFASLNICRVHFGKWILILLLSGPKGAPQQCPADFEAVLNSIKRDGPGAEKVNPNEHPLFICLPGVGLRQPAK